MSAVKLELLVLSYNGQALTAPLSRVCDGGQLTIGRGSDNDLPLSDPERLISRTQARVDVRGSSATIVNVSSSSPLFVNGAELGPGRSTPLAIADQLLIGRYLLTLRAQAVPVPAPRPAVPAPVVTPPARAVLPIPEDFDVFSPPKPAAPAFSMPAADVSLDELVNATSTATRDVFAELQSIGAEVLAEPSEEARQRERILGTPGVATTADPLHLFGSSLDIESASASLDHGLEIESLFVLPTQAGVSAPLPPDFDQPRPVVAAAPAPVAAAPGAVSASAASTAAAERMMADLLGSGPVLDLDPAAALGGLDSAAPVLTPLPPLPPLPPARAAVATSPPPPAALAPTAPPTPVAAPTMAAVPAPPPIVRTPAPVAAVPEAAVARRAAGEDDVNALRAAFARGCGLDISQVSEFTPESLELLGRIMAAMTAGTIRLMHGRSSTKHEMRANVTIIASAGNNPMKFAPDGTSALAQLLGRGSPAFMPPLRAIDDAYDDLCAHQVGLLAGSRAAMYDVAALLGPERFLARAGESSGLESLLPAKRKAKLWDLYESGYQELVGEAREEFENLFQRAFARAYEQENDRIDAGRPS